MSNVVRLQAAEPAQQERIVADVDNGYTRIANEIEEAKCKLKLSGTQWQVYNAIERYTFGYNRKADRIANVQICEITELNPGQVSDALAVLEERKIIVRTGEKHKVKVVAINKVVSDWVLRKQRTSVIKTDNDDYQNREPKLSKPANTKDSSPKTVTKDTKTLCRADAQPRQKDPLTLAAFGVVTHLNELVGGKYPLKSDSNTVKGIRARLDEGFTVADLKLVAEYKLAEWGDDRKMRQYLRPSTLYRPGNCPGYLQAAQAWDAGGRPMLTGSAGKPDMLALCAEASRAMAHVPTPGDDEVLV